jgi:hypothetical protein
VATNIELSRSLNGPNQTNNTAATPKFDTVSSSSNGPWQTVGAAVRLGNDAALDALPPPYGCLGIGIRHVV